MKKIRKHTFETNSSSTHSITVSLDEPVNIMKDLNLYIPIGEFGWEAETYDSIGDLLSYLYTAILVTSENVEDYDYLEKIKHIEKILSPFNIHIEWEKPSFSSGYLETGYIDHSDEIIKFVFEIFDDDDLLLKYIFGGVIQTGNDNDDSYINNVPTYFGDNYYYYYKGN